MANRVGASAEEVLYQKLQYRAASPLEHQLQCLDVLSTVERSFVQKVTSKMSSSLRPLVRQGSMLSDSLMAEKSNWRAADGAILKRMKRGLGDLKDSTIRRPSDANFKKEKLPRLDMSFSSAKGGVLWLGGVAGLELGKEESLSCTLDGLTAASVDYATICAWILAGDWCPNMATLKITSSDWSKDRRSKIKRLWIVTDILYATKFTVTGRKGLLDKVMASVPVLGAPGLSVDVGAEIGVHYDNDTSLELKAKRNKQFIVGYRTTRVEYGLDGTVRALREAQDTGLRGDDDDPRQMNLKSMEEDIFEEDEDGEKAPIPLLTPTAQELNDLSLLVANSSADSEGSAST